MSFAEIQWSQCTAKSNPHVDCGTNVLGSLGLVVPFAKDANNHIDHFKVVGALVVRQSPSAVSFSPAWHS
jgi:hypothetical protein